MLVSCWCDAGEDCDDGSDEEDCQVPCPAGLLQCKDRKECIHESKLCDHSPDCQDVSDEKDCHYIPPACGM